MSGNKQYRNIDLKISVSDVSFRVPDSGFRSFRILVIGF
jgi:hypothetical protein